MDGTSRAEAGSNKKRKAPGPPESTQRGGAKQGSGTAKYTLGKARSVDVEGFVEARAFEINRLQSALEMQRATGNVRAFQTLPRHLRRRAASHNVKRIPARLRERALSEMRKSAQTSKALAGTDRLTNAKKPSRYKRRRARATREEYETRQTGKRWLETHVWHAKRMHMRELWGAVVAETPNERSHRAAYRAAKEKTYIQDVSYFSTLELAGAEDAIASLLHRLSPPGDMVLLKKPYVAGARMAPLTLYCAGMYPLALLGPATALWQPDLGAERRKLWLRLHPANAGAVKAELKRAAENADGRGDPRVQITDITSDLVSFELLGGQSTQLLATVLSQAADSGSSEPSILQLIRAIPSPAVLPESVVIALRIHDPRLEFPFKVNPAHMALSQDGQQQLQNVLLRWPEDAALFGAQRQDAGIWDRDACAKALARRPSEHVLNKRREKQLIPGTKLRPDPDSDVTVPLLLVRTGPEAQLGSRTGRTDRQYIDTLAHGWTLMAPRGWGMPLWMALNFVGARAQGLSERHHVGFEAGLPTFPANWPGTPAYDAWAGAAATAAHQKWLRRPPGKRTNYLKLGIESPFYAPFHRLLRLPVVPDAYPQVTADGLECRMKRLRKIASKKKEERASDQMDTDDDAGSDPAAGGGSGGSTAGSGSGGSTAGSGSGGSTADMWLLAGEALATAAASLLSSARPTPQCDSASPEAFLAWAAPLLDAVKGSSHSSDSDSAGDITLIERCLVRVRLTCTGRGVPAENAPICLHSAKQTAELKASSAIGYVMTSSFSLARGCGMAVGACSLHGLYQAWALAAGSARTKSLQVTVRSVDGGPSISAALAVLP
ncbi:Ribonucleases P/MRP protein subunit pop1 [Coemansia sp. RSA 2618]|nr:Ribonucleases P/MRP protein subunit pop1 [Coemansia sp. RSA 2618]